MDAELRQAVRRASTPEEMAEVLRRAESAGLIEHDQIFLAALMGDPAARLATSTNPDWPDFLSHDWTDLLACLGIESCIQVMVAFGRFYGGDELSIEAVKIGERWLLAVGEAERRAATEEARRMSLEGTLECWERIARLLLAPPEFLDRELWLLLRDEEGRADIEKCQSAIRSEVCAWAFQS